MKKTLFVFSGIILSLFIINGKPADAAWWDSIQIRATSTPTIVPTPTVVKIELNKDIIQKIPMVTLGAKNTVTPTPTPEITNTVAPTITETVAPTTTVMPDETEKATDAANVTTESPTPTPAPTGIQTKDIVTYVLIGAILVVLLAQAFWPKKNNSSETKPEEPKIG